VLLVFTNFKRIKDMSIETEIKHLTEAVKALTAQLQLGANPSTIDVKPIKVEAPTKVEPPQTEQQEPEKTVSRDDLQTKCLQLVRGKPENKTKIKELLAQYDVKIISELKDNQVAAFMANLETEF